MRWQMKNSNKFLITFAFLIISLFAANGFIINSSFDEFQPRFAKSITNYAKIENTSAVKQDAINKLGEIGTSDADDAEKSGSEATPPACKGGSGKVVIEQSSRRVLFGDGEDVKCYPASTTKVLTALVALKNLPLDRVVTVPKEAAGVEGSSIYLKAGQKITVEDLLYGLMLRSGNDAATALAIETAGSVQAFAGMMNDMAKEIGAKNSNFVNPHGLHDDMHYSTARDLAIITAEAYELEDFKRIVSSKLKKIAVDGEEVVIANKNKLLKLFDGANGVKTGYTKKSGRCLIGGAKREDMQLISVVLNCPDMWNESEKLLDFGFENFDMVPLDSALITQTDEGRLRPVEISAPYDVTADWKDMYYPLAKDEYLVVHAA